MATPSSYAFRNGGPGMLRNIQTDQLDEPCALERERAMGYSDDATAAPNTGEAARRRLLGNAMDMRAISALFAICERVSETESVNPPPAVGAVHVDNATYGNCLAPATSSAMLARYGKGSHIATRMGHRPGYSLGLLGDGLTSPVSPAIRAQSGAGLGYTKPLNELPEQPTFPSTKWYSAMLRQLYTADGPESTWSDSLFTPAARTATTPNAASATRNDVVNATRYARYELERALAGQASKEDASVSPAAWAARPVRDPQSSTLDPWLDDPLLRCLRGEEVHRVAATDQDRMRLHARLTAYAFHDGKLERRMLDGTTRIVPKPADRIALIQSTHAKTGHWGINRTDYQLSLAYWWPKLRANVVQVLGACEQCSRVKTAFGAEDPTLHSLPIRALLYRWSADLTKKTLSRDGNRYILVCIEHLARYCELIPIPDKEAQTVANAFRLHILGRFGGCAEVVTDQGSEFKGAFAKLLDEAMIDHRPTSANHPQANGLAERCVQSVKRALRKQAIDGGSSNTWDRYLPWVQLGYNASRQESTKLSPFQILYGVEPSVPPAARPRMDASLVIPDYEDADALAAFTDELCARAAIVKHNCAYAAHNIDIAQHRQSLRYALTRSGNYKSNVLRYEPGDYVYLNKSRKHDMDVTTRATILKVLEISPLGVATLQGRNEHTCKRHIRNLAPCHLNNIDPTTSPVDKVDDIACRVCNHTDGEETMVLCDACNAGYHTTCMEPPLDAVPDGDFFCPDCAEAHANAEPPAVDVPDSRARTQHLEGIALEGARILRRANAAVAPVVGVVHFLGAELDNPRRFEVTYTDQRVEQLSIQEVRMCLLPPNATEADIQARIKRQTATRRSARQHAPRALALAARAPVDSAWDLTSRDGILRAVSNLMPGIWTEGHCTKLSNTVRRIRQITSSARENPNSPSFDAVPTSWPDETSIEEARTLSRMRWGTQIVVTMPDEVRLLAAHVDLAALGHTWDLWAGTGTIQRTLAHHHVTVRSNDLNPLMPRMHTRLDATEPTSYAIWQRAGLDCVISSPMFALLDIALPLAVHFCRQAVCMHVPATYYTDATSQRLAYLRNLESQKRLRTIMHLPRGPLGRRCMWIVIFASPGLARRAMRES